MAWTADGISRCTALAEALADAIDPEDRPWQCVILRAVFRPDEHYSDPGLRHFDAQVEVTDYPADLLWGPGAITDAAAWYAEHQPGPDECDHLDRTFLIQHHDDHLYLPVRAAVAAALPHSERAGTWYSIRADHPNDAYYHVRNIVTAAGCQRRGQCQNCHAETLLILQRRFVTYDALRVVCGSARPWPGVAGGVASSTSAARVRS